MRVRESVRRSTSTNGENMAMIWYDCTIDSAQVSAHQGGAFHIGVTCSAFQNQQSRAAAEVQKEILAVALAALTAGRRVKAAIDLDGVNPRGEPEAMLYALQILAT